MRVSYQQRKLARPDLPATILHRAALITLLKEILQVNEAGAFQYELLLLCAPGGYGKTTLLADFSQQTSLAFAWYSLDLTDIDATTFLRCFVASLQQCFPQFGSGLASMLTEQLAVDLENPHDLNRFVRALTSIIRTIEEEIHEPFVLVISNYYEVRKVQSIHHLVDYLLDHLPEYMLLLIESRSIPPLDLISVLARRKMIGIGSSHFRLSPEEIHQLAALQKVPPLKTEEVDYLIATFDGWIAGVLLGTRLSSTALLDTAALSNSCASEKPLTIYRKRLFSYFVNNVFSCEPEVYQFLKEAAILPQMTEQLCNQLLERNDALTHLEYMARHGLFVSRVEENQQMVFQCHPILQDVLCEELQQTAPGRFFQLYSRAARLFQKEQAYDQAIHCALRAPDEDLAAQIFSEAYLPLLSRGGLETLEYWINSFSTGVIQQHPRLLVAQATLDLARGRQEEADALLRLAEELLSQPQQLDALELGELPILQVEIVLARSKVLYLRGEYTYAQQLCRQALIWLPANEVRLRAEAHLRLGMCANHLGRMIESIQQMQQALQLSGRNAKNPQTARLHSQLANIYHLVGNHALSEYHRLRAIYCWEHLDDTGGKIKNLIAMGVVFQRRGAFYEAETALKEALHSAQKSQSFQQNEAYALVSLGELYQDQNCYDQALILIEDGLMLARKLGDHYLTIYSLCALAATYLFMGDATTAQILLSEGKPVEGSSQAHSIEVELYHLSQATILFYLHLYAEASVLLQEVERALAQIGLKREQLQCLLRLAACHWALENIPAMLQVLETVVLDAPQWGYEQLLSIELQRIPGMWEALLSLPAAREIVEVIMQMTENPCKEKGPVEAERVGDSAEAVTALPPRFTALVPATAASHPVIRIQGFGEPAVLVDGQPIKRWRIARAMELCFFLLDRQRPVHKRHIFAALWPEDEDQIDQKFRSTLYYLRKALGEACIVVSNGCYSLQLQALYKGGIEYDVYAFQEASMQAKQALAANDLETAAQKWHLMTKLYTGDYVQSFYSNWSNFRREELRRTCVDAYYRLAQRAWQHECWDESAAHWQSLLAIDNCMEEAHYGLMQYYLHQGNRGLALRQYQRCVSALHDEMNLTPGPLVQELYHLLAGIPS
ncbi:MAG TPA: BTAD domain-containing putative transcriptional regulator [Ktedonobacteraceae bacterium]|jgi:ATP/maltotriose-dependent transcriptional regulator MalT/DNA-binding SARP family transcriptional activator